MSERARRIVRRWRLAPGGGPESRGALEDLVDLHGVTLPFASESEGVAVIHLDLDWRVTWASLSYVGRMEGRHVIDIAQTPQSALAALEMVRRTLEPHNYRSTGEHGAWETYVAPMWALGRLAGYRIEAVPAHAYMGEPIPLTLNA